MLGAVFLRGSEWFITSPEWRLLSSAIGVLMVLLIIPGGLASLVIKIRDRFVTLIVDRRSKASIESLPTATVTDDVEAVEQLADVERRDDLDDRTTV